MEMEAVDVTAGRAAAHSATSMGSLLRLFKSEYFDAHLHMHYLLKMEQSGVQDYLVNELYKMGQDDIDFYLSQLCQIALLRYHTSSLHRFLLDKTSQSTHFALKICWLLQSVVEDRSPPEFWEHAQTMVQLCEEAVSSSASTEVSRNHQKILEARTPRARPAAQPVAEVEPRMRRRTKSCPDLRMQVLVDAAEPSPPAWPLTPLSPPAPRALSLDMCDAVEQSTSSAPTSPTGSSSLGQPGALRHLMKLAAAMPLVAERGQLFGLQPKMPNAFAELGDPLESLGGAISKLEYFQSQKACMQLVVKLSMSLLEVQQRSERKEGLASTLRLLNRWLFDRQVLMALGTEGQLGNLGLHLPINADRDDRQQILQVCVAECRVFNTKSRAPFLLVYETADLDECLQREATGLSRVAAPDNGQSQAAAAEALAGCVSDMIVNSQRLQSGQANDGVSSSRSSRRESALQRLQRLVMASSTDDWSRLLMPIATPSSDTTMQDGFKDDAPCEEAAADKKAAAERARRAIWGEPWESRQARLRQKSAYGHYKTWALQTVFVKGGDDLRQELLAAQVIQQFAQVFRAAKLPLWLLEVEVLVTSAHSGCTSFIRDSAAVDDIKKKFPDRSLDDIFKMTFADNLFEARRNFIESYAAYSLVVWFLQVKDRHNGNLMLLSDGHIVHIDFGFMLSNSPGRNMAFEQSPFMMTQEFLDIMGGEYSIEYEYFRTLVIRGFLEARKQIERLTLPVRMMLAGSTSRMPCFREGAEFVLTTLRDRFFEHLTEEACIDKVIELIDTSANHWSTSAYHTIQRITNGIL
eukprot:TRINITY_DN19284_c0_g1_i6.p1 TRINITY_DN19284_c0_g1~~TRINITY_DN19284_c0_g1_i6.p1  ORF type:complete len:874 (-),score=160.14 TRINITY_DN19284_c0_g1_i6:59-2476(-)